MSKESGVTAPSMAITPRVNWLQTETKHTITKYLYYDKNKNLVINSIEKIHKVNWLEEMFLYEKPL